MNFTFLRLVITQCVLLFDVLVYAQYNKKVECVIGKDGFHICTTVQFDSLEKRNSLKPSYEHYIPRTNTIFYNCSMFKCEPFLLKSMIQVLLQPKPGLRQCYLETPSKYTCEPVKYHLYKNIDKLLFLKSNIPTNKYYLADCLLYSDGERVCHKKDNVDTHNAHAKLVDTGTLVRPNEDNILSQNELLCEETENKKINCDFNVYVPYSKGLKQKKLINIIDNILLKTGSYIISLKLKCVNSWCGYSGELMPTRRLLEKREPYEPPGGSVYRCYYAKKQQICKKLYGPHQLIYNERDWFST